MNLTAKVLSLVGLLIIASSLVMLKGCGNTDNEEGCPAQLTLYTTCENWALDTDSITGPASGSLSMGSGFSGGSVYYSQFKYVIYDSKGKPRNNICIELTTDGYFYTDRNYSNVAPSLGAMPGHMILRTDDYGATCVYWSTEDLPMSGSEDITGDSWIHAYSGAISHDYQIDWTVTAL